jgi:hypothetical protein
MRSMIGAACQLMEKPLVEGMAMRRGFVVNVGLLFLLNLTIVRRLDLLN